jgi:hypothetical protein
MREAAAKHKMQRQKIPRFLPRIFIVFCSNPPAWVKGQFVPTNTFVASNLLSMKSASRLLFLMMLFTMTAAARNNGGSVGGKVFDEQGEALPGAYVLLTDIGGKEQVKAGVTDIDGAFLLEAASGLYLLSVKFPGMEDHATRVEIPGEGTLTLPVVTMKPAVNTLSEVTVRARKPMIEVQPDKLVVNVENSIVNAGASALEVLARSPGVRVDQNDNISLKGRPGVMVMIDGKLTPMSGTDLATMLKSMPSSSLEKIEIISNPGAKYDAAGTGGIINIRTRKEQQLGWNGSVNTYYTQGVYPKAGLGGSLNYRGKKVNVYLNGNFGYRYWFNHLMLDRRFYDTTTGRQLFRYDQDNYAVYNFRNPAATFGMDYNLTRKTTTGFVVNGNINRFDPKADNKSKALDADDRLLYYFNTTGRHHNTFYNASANVYLRHRFEEGKELSVDVDYAAFGNSSRQQFVTTYTTPEGAYYQPDYFLKSNLNGITQIRAAKADYTGSLTQHIRMETGLKSSYVTADNKPLFYEMINDTYELDTRRSNHFLYDENINAAYLTLKGEHKRWSSQLGLRAEQTNAAWKQLATGQYYDTSYLQLFPSVAVRRNLTAQHDLGLTLSRRIERPSYEQLNPFKFFVDKTTYKEGYPYLKPASSYNAELSHTFRQKFITSVVYSITENVITEVIQPSDHEDSVTVQTNKNLRRMTFVGLNGTYPFEITRWWTNTTSFNAYYALYEGNIANTNLRNGSPTFDVNTSNSFILPEGFSAELSLFYQARQIYGFMDVHPLWMLNAGIQKHLLARRATLRLNVQDIFWKGYPRARSVYTGYREDFVAVRDTRQLTISFTYRFGNKTNTPFRQRSGGAEEEKRRAATGSA